MNQFEEYAKKKFEFYGFDVIKIGKPDFIVLKDGKIWFVELKLDTDSISTAQNDAMTKLGKHGYQCYVYQPNHFRHSFYRTFVEGV